MPLPEDILASRLRNEIAACSKYLSRRVEIPEEGPIPFPLLLEIELVKIPGPVMSKGKVVRRYEHMFKVIVTRDYPFEKPQVMWQTPIFHPNIMMPDDGGHLCTKLLEEWSFNSTIISFVKGVESLLINPNPDSPFGTDSCTAAAQYFNNGKRHLPPLVCSPSPKVVRSE